MLQTKTFSHSVWRMLPLTSVTLTDGFWSDWQHLNQQTTLAHGYHMLEEAGNLDNMRIAAGLKEGQYRGMVFRDSDIYKWLEAVGYQLTIQPDAALQAQADGVIDLVAAAQQPDGYLNTFIQITNPAGRWSDLDFGHELYCAGHLFQGAAAYYRGTNTTKLLDVATRFADMLATTFGVERQGTCGHPEIELALVELYRVTGNRKYLDLAKYFVDQRGKGVMRGMDWMKAEYHQDRVPVRQEDRVEGHAVRAMYLNAGVADLYLETGETALLEALNREWEDMVSGKLFLTGGVGARYEGESFGDAYELPPDRCYCETCAAIGSVMWNWRMLLITGEGRFADLLERTLYNGVLSGLGLDGKNFFYMNPLQSRGNYKRVQWNPVACCPPNLMRLLASLGQYFVTQSADGLQIHLYGSTIIKAETPHPVTLTMQTDYPWDGKVKLSVDQSDGSTWTLRLRQPDWCSQAAVSINGQAIRPKLEAGYLVLERAWQPGDVIDLTLTMEAVLIEAHPRVDAIRDSVAIQRGPLIYCLEANDHPGIDLMDVQLSASASLRAVWRDDLVSQGMMAIQSSGFTIDHQGWQGQLYRRMGQPDESTRQATPITAIPYYAWANRGANQMRVWIPRLLDDRNHVEQPQTK